MKLSGSQYQCTTCGEHFAGPVAFAAHRTGEYEPIDAQCLTACQMRTAGMSLNRAGFWATPPLLQEATA